VPGPGHLKRLLAYSTFGHAGLFIIALSSPDPAAVAGGALYVLAHAGTKAALFLMAGAILNRYGRVDEIDLHGRGRDATLLPWLMLLAGLALAGLPPLGPGLGKAIAEHALGGPWLTALFVATSALTGAAVLRAALRIYFGFGPPAADDVDPGPTRSGEEDAETDTLLQRLPLTMLVPIVVLLGASVVLGFMPGLCAAVAGAAATFLDAPGYAAAALGSPPPPPPPVPEVGWTAEGALLGLAGAVLASGAAHRRAEAVHQPADRRVVPARGEHRILPVLRRVRTSRAGPPGPTGRTSGLRTAVDL
jgi:multicomponent Na+:H+ antiporter subunit D